MTGKNRLKIKFLSHLLIDDYTDFRGISQVKLSKQFCLRWQIKIDGLLDNNSVHWNSVLSFSADSLLCPCLISLCLCSPPLKWDKYMFLSSSICPSVKGCFCYMIFTGPNTMVPLSLLGPLWVKLISM